MWFTVLEKYAIYELKNNRAMRGFRNYLMQKPVLRMNKPRPRKVERLTQNNVHYKVQNEYVLNRKKTMCFYFFIFTNIAL